MYATAEVSVGEAEHVVTLPQTCISYNPYGNTVFVVKAGKGKDDLNVEQIFVTLGKTRGDQVQILKGVDEGNVVVSSGQLKLQNGSAIVVNNTVEPKNDADPKPEEK
jgi:membrane fusion protein (multidrug efflux system)